MFAGNSLVNRFYLDIRNAHMAKTITEELLSPRILQGGSTDF